MLFDIYGNNDTEELSTEDRGLIMEALMLDISDCDELSMFLEDSNEVNKAITDEVVLEKTIVRLDKKAKLSRARKTAIFTVAKEKNDKLFKKLLWCWKMERSLEAKLDKKYGNEATRRAKKAMQDAGKSKSNFVKNIADKASSVFNKEK